MRFQHRVPVRFRDLDAMGHVHHSAPLLYIEEARAAYWRSVAGRASVADIDYVMGEVSLRFHREIHYPAELVIGLRVSELGGSSFRMEYEVRDEAGELLVSGTSVQVLYDYEARRSTPIPAALRGRIETYERGPAAERVPLSG
ncbi:MAG TPA: thioesterase family protein [Longimicrobiales bacterium]|nr:thioesterase family protein [Longimicrobiales bacterium]